jgi:uncharacterized lipoprotein YajG
MSSTNKNNKSLLNKKITDMLHHLTQNTDILHHLTQNADILHHLTQR